MVVGRVSAQKDPQFLLDTIKNLQAFPEHEQIAITWLGGGDSDSEEALKQAGVKVTGMIPHTQLMQTLENADLYLHTAAWEGMPLTLLEASRMQVPMILRIIGATDGLLFPYLAATPQSMAAHIVKFCREPDNPNYQAALNDINRDFSEENQREALLSIYGV